MRRAPPTVLVFAVLLALVVACGSSVRSAGVTIEPITKSPAPAAKIGGKPATPPIATAPDPAYTPDAQAPTEGRWIDVDLTRFVVRLMDGGDVLRSIGPVAVGAEIDTGAYDSTQTGLFHIYNKMPELAYDPPYKTYISDWVGFDPKRANGFHSFLKDTDGRIVDASTGGVSNGCIRTPDPTAITAFAEIGMPVYVHT